MLPSPHASAESVIGQSENAFKKAVSNGLVNKKSFTSKATFNGGALSPDIKPNDPLLILPKQKTSAGKKLGKYILSDHPDDNFTGPVFVSEALDTETGSCFVCRIYLVGSYKNILSPYWVVGSHENINFIQEIILTSRLAYVFFIKTYEDLHSFIRRRRILKDDEICWLFSQVVSAVKHCHDNGVVLRDLKLRKFVFKDSCCSHLLLENLEDSYILKDQESDILLDRHGCPAYVSPEILFSAGGYSGKLADVWSLGVILYTLMTGQYPFHDTDVGALFKKIRQGVYPIPEGATKKGKCLLRNILRVDSSERMHIDEILSHPWFKKRNFSRFKSLQNGQFANSYRDSYNGLNFGNIPSNSFNNNSNNTQNNHLHQNHITLERSRSAVEDGSALRNLSSILPPPFNSYPDPSSYVKTSDPNNENESMRSDHVVPMFNDLSSG